MAFPNLISWLLSLVLSYITWNNKNSLTEFIHSTVFQRVFNLLKSPIILSSLYSFIFIFSNFFIISIICLISFWYISLWNLERAFLIYVNLSISSFIFSQVFLNLSCAFSGPNRIFINPNHFLTASSLFLKNSYIFFSQFRLFLYLLLFHLMLFVFHLRFFLVFFLI